MAETACIAPYPSKSMTSSSKDFPAFGPNPAPLHSYTGNGGLTSYTFNGGVPSSKPSALGPTYSSNNGIAAVASIASTGSSAYNVIQGVNSGLHSNGNPLVQSGRGSEDLSVSSVDGPPFSSSKGAICSSNEQSNPADGKAVATVELTPSRRPSLWYEEEIDESLRWSFGLTSILFTGCSRFQEIALLDTEPFGKVLTLDRKMQSAEKDEWVYHECLVHPPLLLHPSPKSVYIMGGGEGSTAREALRHKSVKKVVMCDIDEEVVKFCRSYLTCNAEAFRSSRLELVIDDAKANLESREDRFDVIIGDLADPLECGPCYLLYTKGFYQSIVKPKLNPNGILVTQAGPAGILTHKELFCIVITSQSCFYLAQGFSQSRHRVLGLVPSVVCLLFIADVAAMSAQAALQRLSQLAVAVGIGGSFLSASLYTVDGGEQAVIFDRFRGVLDKTVGEGTHILIPWLQRPIIFDIRTHAHTVSSVTGTKDLQMVNLGLRVLYRPDTNRLPEIYKRLGVEYNEKVLPSIGNEVLKAVVAQFDADQLLTERPYVSSLVRESLLRRAKEFDILLDDVAITHLSYGAEFSRAVEQKQVAQQEAERSKFIVAKAEQEKRAAVIRAEGESEAAKLISDATAQCGPALIELRRIEASREIAGTLSKTPNVMYVPEGNNMLFAMNSLLK